MCVVCRHHERAQRELGEDGATLPTAFQLEESTRLAETGTSNPGTCSESLSHMFKFVSTKSLLYVPSF